MPNETTIHDDLSHLTNVYLSLHIVGGQICLPILIVVFLFAKHVSRHPTLTNFLFSWVLYSVSYSLLKYSTVEATQDTQSVICLVQSALIHGTPIMAGVSGLAVMIQIWATFVYPQHSSLGVNWSRSTVLTTILVLPYLALIIFATISAIVAYQHPETVTMSNGLYCTTTYPPFRYVVPAVSSVFLLLVLGFEFAIGIRYYKMSRQITTVFPLANRTTSKSLLVRVTIFNLGTVVVFASTIFGATQGTKLVGWTYMINASIPLAAAIIFGTQKDLWPLLTCNGSRNKPEHGYSDDSIPSAHHLNRSTQRLDLESLPGLSPCTSQTSGVE